MPQDTRNLSPQLEALEKVDPGKSLVAKLSGHEKAGNHKSGQRKGRGRGS